MTDRLDCAWELRRDVHAWIMAHPDCRMIEITAAFPLQQVDTLRSVVKKLRGRGFVASTKGQKNRSTYRATAAEIEPRDSARNAIRAGGRCTGARNGALMSGRLRKPAAAGPVAEPGKYTNKPYQHPPLPYQGGQFDGGTSINGCSSLHLLR